MTLHRFYTTDSLAESVGRDVALPPMESSHAVKVLRLRPGDELVLMDGCGREAFGTLVSPEGKNRLRDVSCHVERVVYTEPAVPRVHLYVAPPRNRNMDLILKAATELGVYSITPVSCQFGVAKSELGATKSSWEQQLIVGIKQSRNAWLPLLAPMLDFGEAVAQSPIGVFGAVPQPGEQIEKGLAALKSRDDIALWIGPEGGFSPEEERRLREAGMIPLTVGRWVLRVETAVIALLAVLERIVKQEL